MYTIVKRMILAALCGVLLMTGGCGGGDDTPPMNSATAPIAATVNADGTATTGPAATTAVPASGTPGYLAAVSATLPPNTVITARNADGTAKALTAAPSFTFTAPPDSSASFSGVSGVPAPAGFTTLTSTSGAVDVQLTGAASATFNPAITITMPVPGKAVGSVVAVYSVTGSAYTFLGSFTVTSAGFVSFPVSGLSWKVADPNPDPNTPPPTIPTTIVPTTTATTTVPPTTVPTTIPTTVLTTVPATTTTVATTVPTTVPTTIPTTIATTAPTTTTTIPPLACGSCHAIPPATGRHTFHVSGQGISCSACHGSGYSASTVNTATHNNGVVNSTCTTLCHGSRSW